MISQSGKNIQVKEIRWPIQVMKQINVYDFPKQYISNFIASTVDKKIMMIEINSDKIIPQSNYSIKQLENIVTQIFYDAKSKTSYLGCHNGDILKCKISAPTNLIIQNFYIAQKQPSKQNCIVLVYPRQQMLLAWDIENIIKVVQIKTGKLKNTIKMQYNICCGIYFQSPFINQIVGCVAFDIMRPPIIFDCQTQQKFNTILQNSISIYEKQQAYDDQIIMMVDSIHHTDKQNLIIYGSTNQPTNLVCIYDLKYDYQSNLTYLQAVCKIEVRSYIFHLSFNFGMVMTSFEDGFMIFDIQNRKRLLSIKKPNLQITSGFILQSTSDTIKFMFNEGFSFRNRQKWSKKKKIKFGIREKTKQSQI